MKQVDIQVHIKGLEGLSDSIMQGVNSAIYKSINDSLLVIRDSWR